MASLDVHNVEDLYDSLADGSYKSIVLVLGAGISVSAGIPDFRSPGGLFEAVREHFGEKFPEVIEKPEHLLSREFCLKNPAVWKNEVVPMLRSWKLEDAKPTITHKMIGWLHNQGWLTRVYTQNIDGLELHPEILELLSDSGYSESIIQAHGSMRDGTVVLYFSSLHLILFIISYDVLSQLVSFFLIFLSIFLFIFLILILSIFVIFFV